MSATLTCTSCGKVIRRTAGALRRWFRTGDRTGTCPACESTRIANTVRRMGRAEGRRRKAEMAG